MVTGKSHFWVLGDKAVINESNHVSLPGYESTDETFSNDRNRTE